MISKKFIGRKFELKELNNYYDKSGFQNIIIYGRRRVGKTTLVLEFLKDKKGVYFLSEKNDFEKQAQRLVNNFSKNNNIFPEKVENFYEAFEFIISNINNSKYIIIIDEFPYLVEENKSILSQFQRIIDELLVNSNLYLILLGSSISIMEQEVLGYNSPLYARRTAQFKIKPLDFGDLFEWFNKKSFEDILKIYSIVDSIPLYLNKIDENLTFEENLENNFFKESDFLFEEVFFLLNSELRETKNYKKILFAIANGKNRLSEIANESRIQINVLTNYIDTLLNLHIIKKEYPVTDKKGISRNSIYKFQDNYFNFWFRYIYPNLELFEERKYDDIKRIIFKTYNIYLSFIFEDICRIFLKKINDEYNKVGTYWHKNVEIDICGINDEKNKILFGECKWQDNIDASKILRELNEKSQYVKWKGDMRKEIGDDRIEEFVIFAKSFKEFRDKGVENGDIRNVSREIWEKENNCKLYDLKDLERIFMK